MSFAMKKWYQTAFFPLLNIEMQGREHTMRTHTHARNLMWRRIGEGVKFPTLFIHLSVKFALQKIFEKNV